MKKISKLEELIVEERFRESTEEISLDMHHSAAITYFLDPSSMLQFERRDALTISALAQSMQSESKEYASMSYDDQQSILENVSDFNLAYAEVLKRESVEEDIPTESVKMLLQNAKSAAEKGLSEFRSDKFAEDILEATHNGIVAYEKESNIQPILIRGTEDYIKTQEIWKIVKEFFEGKNIEYKEIVSVNGGILSKLINLIYTLDYSSIFLAIKNKTDPTPIKPIDFVKNKINEIEKR